MSDTVTFRQWMNQVKATSLAEALAPLGSQRIGRYQVELANSQNPHFVDEPSLLSQGIRLTRSEEKHLVDSAALYWVLAIRTGITLSAIQQTQKHLSKRISEGKSTLQQKTVQSEIGEALSLISEVLALTELDAPLTTLPPLSPQDYAHLSQCLTQAASRVSRLMGGHGFIKGGIEFPLSLSHHLWSLTQSEPVEVARV